MTCPPSCAITAQSTHDVPSLRQEKLATQGLGALEIFIGVCSEVPTSNVLSSWMWKGPEPANVLVPEQPVWQARGLPGILLIRPLAAPILPSRGPGWVWLLLPF